MECITLKNLTFRGLHGYLPEERRDGNTFEVDVTIWAPLHKAAQSDNLEETVDYNHISKIVREVMEGESVRLLETLLYKTGEAILPACPEAEKIEVAIRKLHPPMPVSCEYSEVRSQWPK